MDLTKDETALLLGGPRCCKREVDGSVRLSLTEDDTLGRGSGTWVVYARLGWREVVASQEEAMALARRVLERDADDDLRPIESKILDRRAEALLEASARAVP